MQGSAVYFEVLSMNGYQKKVHRIAIRLYSRVRDTARCMNFTELFNQCCRAVMINEDASIEYLERYVLDQLYEEDSKFEIIEVFNED